MEELRARARLESCRARLHLCFSTPIFQYYTIVLDFIILGLRLLYIHSHFYSEALFEGPAYSLYRPAPFKARPARLHWFAPVLRTRRLHNAPAPSTRYLPSAKPQMPTLTRSLTRPDKICQRLAHCRQPIYSGHL